jgi:hypothetical protein
MSMTPLAVSALALLEEHPMPDGYVLEQQRRLALLDCDIAWTDDALKRLSTGELVWSYDDHRPVRCTKETPE